LKLELQDIEVEFRRGQPVLKEVQLSIPSGCRLALLGSNGSGKSTLLHCLLGLIRPNQGRILVDGTDLAYDRRSLSLHRQKLGLLLQDPDDQLMAVTVEDDVALGPRNLGLSAVETEERVASACSQVGLDALRTSPIQGLSTGLKKRIALAGLLAMRPKVLILDEPTAGLDHQGCSSLLALLLELEQQGVSLIIATHDLDLVARWADQVAVLQDGKIGILDTPLNVFQRSGSLSGLPLITEVSRSLVPNHPEFIRDAQQLLALLQPSSQCKAKNIHLGQI
jgi:cobalt/nickel transport system ATP-binding protein